MDKLKLFKSVLKQNQHACLIRCLIHTGCKDILEAIYLVSYRRQSLFFVKMTYRSAEANIKL